MLHLCRAWRKPENPACLPSFWQFNLGITLALHKLFTKKTVFCILKAQVNCGPKGRKHCTQLHNSYSITLKPNGSLRQKSQKERETISVKLSDAIISLETLSVDNGSAFSLELIQFLLFTSTWKKSFPPIYS